MSLLLITPGKIDEINRAVEDARKNVIPWEKLRKGAVDDPTPVLTLDQRKPDAPIRPPSTHIRFEGGVEAAISFEEQPAGIFRHMSVSVAAKGKLPNMPVVQLLAQLFGFEKFPPDPGVGRLWVEEYEPGAYALNVIEIAVKREEGHA